MTKPSMVREIENRIERLRAYLHETGLDGILLVQKIDVFYFSRTDQDAHLWIPSRGDPLLMVRKDLERAREHALIEKILPLESFSRLPEYITNHAGRPPRTIGLEMDVLPASLYLRYRKLFPGAQMADVSDSIRKTRMIKSAHEIAVIKKAASVADQMFEMIPHYLRESETETDLALRAESFYRKRGHSGLSRTRAFNMESTYGHILSGPAAATPSSAPGPTGGAGLGPWFSQGAGPKRLDPHETIVVDYTACVDGYLSDQARIFSKGDLPDKFYRAHDTMLKIQDRVSKAARPGVPISEAYRIAFRIADKYGLAEGFMGHPKPVPFIGHGIGLELDEWPVVSNNPRLTFQKGMVIALEPKYIFPGEGVVGIENVFTVEDQGLVRLTHFPDPIHIIMI